MEVPEKTKNRVAIGSSNPTPMHIPDKTIIQKDTCTPMFTAVLFTIAKTWKQPKCPSMDKWIKMWYVCVYTHTHTHTHTCYKASDSFQGSQEFHAFADYWCKGAEKPKRGTQERTPAEF